MTPPTPTTTPSIRAIVKASRVHRFPLTKKSIIIGSIVVVSIGLLIVGAFAYQQTIADGNVSKVPEYPTVVPDHTTIHALGGWKRISPPKNDPVFAYADSIDGVPIQVSQQPLPAPFRNNPGAQVAELAKQGNYTTIIDAGNTKVYVGISIKGPQSAVMAKDGLLIFITSQKKIADSSWATYVKSLQ